MLGTFPSIWTEWYGESVSIGGLNYLSVGIASFTGLILNFSFIDRIHRNLKTKHNGVGRARVPNANHVHRLWSPSACSGMVGAYRRGYTGSCPTLVSPSARQGPWDVYRACRLTPWTATQPTRPVPWPPVRFSAAWLALDFLSSLHLCTDLHVFTAFTSFRRLVGVSVTQTEEMLPSNTHVIPHQRQY
ncbi:hypothetical protein V8C34DRAFT_277053 [Trichoderma compactum]